MKLKVVVYSDYICPFCFIGKSRVDRLKKELGVEVEWKGFEIHPETPADGRPLEDLGFSRDQIEAMSCNLRRMAEDDELEFIEPDKISNSKLALLAAEFAREKGSFDAFHDELFSAYWQKKEDIGDKEVINGIIKNLGLDVDEFKSYLESGSGEKKLKKYLDEVWHYGISGVPTFIIGDRTVVGAQPYEVLKKVVVEQERGG